MDIFLSFFYCLIKSCNYYQWHDVWELTLGIELKCNIIHVIEIPAIWKSSKSNKFVDLIKFVPIKLLLYEKSCNSISHSMKNHLIWTVCKVFRAVFGHVISSSRKMLTSHPNPNLFGFFRIKPISMTEESRFKLNKPDVQF